MLNHRSQAMHLPEWKESMSVCVCLSVSEWVSGFVCVSMCVSVHGYDCVYAWMCIGMRVHWYKCVYVWVCIGMNVFMYKCVSVWVCIGMNVNMHGCLLVWLCICVHIFLTQQPKDRSRRGKRAFSLWFPSKKQKKELFYLTLIFIAVSAVVCSDLRSLNLTGVHGRLKHPPPVPAVLISISCQSPLSERSPFISPGPASLSLRGFMCFCFIGKDPWSRHSLKLIRASKKKKFNVFLVSFFFLSLRDIRCRRDCRGHCKYFGCREKENIMIELAEEKKNCSWFHCWDWTGFGLYPSFVITVNKIALHKIKNKKKVTIHNC